LSSVILGRRKKIPAPNIAAPEWLNRINRERREKREKKTVAVFAVFAVKLFTNSGAGNQFHISRSP
jgi:hypothetical protein